MFSRTAANLFRIHELRFAKKYLRISQNDVAIDIACGIGLFTNYLFSKCKNAVGLDISLNNIKIAQHFRQNNIFFLQADAENIPHPDKVFDILISICALEHFSNPDRAIREFYRILKPQGKILLTVDSLNNIKSQEFINFHKKYCSVCNYFSENSIKQLLEKNGFDVIVVKSLLRSEISIILCIFAFKIMNSPIIFNLFSILAYPITFIADLFSFSKSGITIGIYAKKR
ncbi:MAG TPA: class I SAM-dependent methyltransferase [Victivallales bacterium]|nr:class I SAM-dependent methyltransferase [Victivallales bacterium]